MSIIITRGIKCLLHARVTAREETAIELRLQSSDARPKIPVARGMWIYKDQVCLFAEGLGSDSTPVRHHPRDAVHCLVEGESPLLPSLLLDREAIESAGSCSRLTSGCSTAIATCDAPPCQSRKATEAVHIKRRTPLKT